MPFQFRIVEGADQGRLEGMPEVGVVTIGSSKKHADIHLNDLYVVRVHGEVELDGQRVMLTAHDSPSGTQVNGQAVRQQEIRHGDIVRMGNSQLRLEDCEIAKTEAPPEEDVPELEVEVLAEGDEAAAVEDDSTGMAHALPGERLKELVGHDLAHYHVEEVLGLGLCGCVFQALDLKKNQLVALKVLAADFPHNEEETKHYVSVWKKVLPLRHANIVPLYGVGKSGPFCWLASERVEHAPLTEIFERIAKKDTINWLRGYRVAVQIGRALAFAHEQGVIHGNISARHVLWNSSDKVAKLSDLGLATALQGSNIKKITLREKMQNDLVYFSPEQTQPDNFVGGECDIYSLGVVVYTLLTGRFPYVGDSQAETIRKIRDGQLTRPMKLQPDIPKKLDAIVQKMLARKQENRYQTADEMLDDLQVVGEQEDALV